MPRQDRAETVLLLLAGSACGLVVAILLLGIAGPDGRGTPSDFLAFQAAAQLAAAGEAAAAYDWDRLVQVQRELLGWEPGAPIGYLGWLNPPAFFFVVHPFAALPYAWAWLAWIGVSVLGFALALNAVLPRPAAILVAFCTPAVVICLGIGQNGLLSGALIVVALTQLDRRPAMAGIALGLLTMKPQLGLLFPVLLAATGRWRVFVVAAAVGLALSAAATLAFGPESWAGFMATLSGTKARYLADAASVHPRIQSIYAFALHLTGREGSAIAVHAAVAAGAAAAVLRLWMRRPEGPAEARAAALIAGMLLMPPYLWIHDTPVVAAAALFLARAGLRDGFLPGEPWLLALPCLLTGAVLLDDSRLVTPIVALLVLGLAWRRDRAWRLSRAPGGSPS